MIGGLHHSAISVRDMEKSLAFYRDMLGMKVSVDTELSGPEMDQAIGETAVKARVVLLEGKNGGMLELIQFLQPKPPDRPAVRKFSDLGICEIALEVKNIDKLGQELEKKGVKFRYPPLTLELPRLGKVKFTHLLDPDGVQVELVEL